MLRLTVIISLAALVALLVGGACGPAMAQYGVGFSLSLPFPPSPGPAYHPLTGSRHYPIYYTTPYSKVYYPRRSSSRNWSGGARSSKSNSSETISSKSPLSGLEPELKSLLESLIEGHKAFKQSLTQEDITRVAKSKARKKKNGNKSDTEAAEAYKKAKRKFVEAAYKRCQATHKWKRSGRI
jgi:hypothetical protein